MTEQTAHAPNAQVLNIVWIGMLVSPLLIALILFFVADNMAGISGLPADYDIGFLVGGLASAAISLPMLRRFREAVELPRGAERDGAYWQRVNAAMMRGISAAEAPFFIGLAGYLSGGYTQTAAILLIVTLALQFRFKPPAR